jgi:hypothetical protein
LDDLVEATMTFLPFGHVMSFPVPIKLSRVQLRMAIELAAQEAAKRELQRQIGEAVGVPPESIEIDGASVDFNMHSYPTPDLGGIPIEWVD